MLHFLYKFNVDFVEKEFETKCNEHTKDIKEKLLKDGFELNEDCYNCILYEIYTTIEPDESYKLISILDTSLSDGYLKNLYQEKSDKSCFKDVNDYSTYCEKLKKILGKIHKPIAKGKRIEKFLQDLLLIKI